MTSRTTSSLEFGSDSFLDIIANIVGILIILIVIAGLRVSRAPLTATKRQPNPDSQIVLADADAVPRLRPMVPQRSAALDSHAGLRLPAPEVSRKSLSSMTRPVLTVALPERDNHNEVAQFQQAQADLRDQLRRVKTRQKQATAQAVELDTTLADLRSTLEVTAQVNQGVRDEIKQLEQAVRNAESRAGQLANALDAVSAKEQSPTAIRHRLTSIGRTVRGEEMHFRIAAGRIAAVPLKALEQRLKDQVMRNKSWLVKFHKHEGYVGPVDGFTMTYVVERQSLSRIEQLRTGSGGMRIGVSKWTIHRQPDLKTESVEEALKVGGRFRQLIQLASDDSALTFWIYPDSFAAYRRLREFAHQLGFTVAGRPLPPGAQISGSPQGSRSSGQ